MSELRPRVTGTEMEWGVGLRLEDSDGFIQASSVPLGKIAAKVSSPLYLNREMLVNGARCYRDGDFLEYATGEDDSFMGTVANEIAGEQKVAEALEQYASEDPDVEAYQLLKRVHHNLGVTAGYHINLSADATKFNLREEHLYDLGLWAATCSMYTGAGCVQHLTPEGPVRLAIAQKTLEVKKGFSSGTMGDKPLVCLRNEPLSDPGRFHRIQLVAVDPNIAPWASWMALGTASLCLRAIEQSRQGTMRLKKRQMSPPQDEPLARLAREVAVNQKLDTLAEREDGSTISALDIQWELYARAAETEHTEEEARVLQNWYKVLESIGGDRKFLDEKAGWPVRHKYLRHYAEKHGISLRDPALAYPDRIWDSMKQDSVAERLRRRLWASDMPPAELIADRRDNPCPNTRALLRSNAIKESVNYEFAAIDWSSYKLGTERVVRLKDPLMTTIPEYDDKPYYEPEDEDDDGFYGYIHYGVFG